MSAWPLLKVSIISHHSCTWIWYVKLRSLAVFRHKSMLIPFNSDSLSSRYTNQLSLKHVTTRVTDDDGRKSNDEIPDMLTILVFEGWTNGDRKNRKSMIYRDYLRSFLEKKRKISFDICILFVHLICPSFNLSISSFIVSTRNLVCRIVHVLFLCNVKEHNSL